MRRPPAFALLLLPFAALVSACGNDSSDPTNVVESDGSGEAAVAVFRVTDGKITLWHQLPPVSTETQAA